MSYNLNAEGDNGVRDTTKISPLRGDGEFPQFHDRYSSPIGDRPHDPRYPTLLRVESDRTFPDSIVAIRGIGAGDAPGIVGNGSEVDGTAAPGVMGVGGGINGTGVVGISAQVLDSNATNRNRGVGVLGIAANSDSYGVLGESPSGTGVRGDSESGPGVSGVSNTGSGVEGRTLKHGTGVLGRAQGDGVAVAGIASANRGGVFASGTNSETGLVEAINKSGGVVAQIRLVPAGGDELPMNGLEGDLIVGKFLKANEVELWLCVRSSSTTAAEWMKVTMETRTAGTA
jgi:hypothetical protein